MENIILNSQFEKLSFFTHSWGRGQNTPEMRTTSSSRPGTPGYWGGRQSARPEEFNPRTAGMVAGTGAALGAALGASRGGLRGGLRGGAIGLGLGALGYLGRNYMHNRLDKSSTYGNYRGNTQMHSSRTNSPNRYRNSRNYGNYNVDYGWWDPAFGATLGGLIFPVAYGVARHGWNQPWKNISMKQMFGKRGGIGLLGAAAGLAWGLNRNYQNSKTPSRFMPRQQARAGTR